MPRVADHLSCRSQRGLSTQGALWTLAFGMIGLIYGGFAIMKMVPQSDEREVTFKAEASGASAECASRMMQVGTEVYDPRQTACVIPQNGPSIWAVHARWSGAKDFLDRDAKWFGPGSLQQRGDGTELCPELTGIETVLYARTVTIPRAERVKLEAFIDEEGRVTLEHLEQNRVLLDHKTHDKRFARSVTLPRGTIRILVEAADRDTSTGILFSLRGTDKRPLALSGETDWCIFRLDSPTAIPVLLEQSSRCHPCLGGTQTVPM